MSEVEQLAENRFALKGKLTFSGIEQIRNQLESALMTCSGAVEVDFSGVTAVDSSALSLWLCALRLAKKQNLKLTATNLHDDMQAIATLVGLKDQFAA